MLQFIANSCPIAALRRRSSQRIPKSDGLEKKFATQFTLVGQYCLVVGTYNPRTALLRLTVREALFSSLVLFPSLLASPLLFRSLPRRQKGRRKLTKNHTPEKYFDMWGKSESNDEDRTQVP